MASPLSQRPAGREQIIGQIGEDGSRLRERTMERTSSSFFARVARGRGIRQKLDPAILVARRGFTPARLTVRSLSDHQAHHGHKRALAWFGYKVHVSETCDKTLPHLTSDASTTDMEQTAPIHQGLSERGLGPGEHGLDAGCIDAERVLQSREQRMALKLPGQSASQWPRQSRGRV